MGYCCYAMDHIYYIPKVRVLDNQYITEFRLLKSVDFYIGTY